MSDFCLVGIKIAYLFRNYLKRQNLYQEADYLFTGPMKRCVETAGILYPRLEPVVIPEWEEIDFGMFEYKNYEELKDDENYQGWIDSKGTADFPGGESRAAFVGRCGSGFQRMFEILEREHTKEPVRVSAIVHGGTIMALLSSYAKEGCRKGYFDYQITNGRGYLTLAKCRKETETETRIWIEKIEEL